MIDNSNISLSFSYGIILLGILGICITKTNVGFLIGAFLSYISFSRVILFSGIALIWLLALSGVMAGILYYFKFYWKKIKITPLFRWIIPIMLFWWFYTLFTVVLTSPIYERALIRNIFMYMALPIPIIYLIAKDRTQVNGFIFGYILTTLLNGLIIMDMIGIQNNIFSINQWISSALKIQLAISNYHRIGISFGISTIFLFSMILNSKTKLKILYFLPLFIFILTCLFLIGSRQLILASIISISFSIFLRIKKNQGRGNALIYFLLIFISLLIYFIYDNFQSIILRSGNFESALDQAYIDRIDNWFKGIKLGVNSLIFGTYFSTRYGHNLFISTFESQGLVGLSLLLFYFYFVKKVISIGKDINWELLAMIFIFIFGVIHGQFSGDFVSIPHLYWPIAFLWGYFSSEHNLEENRIGRKIF